MDQLLNCPTARVHLVGCGGAGMRALAEFGCDLSWRVSGTDAVANSRTFERLAACGVKAVAGHSAGLVTEDVDLIVHSPAVADSNEERTAARLRSVPDVSYPAILGAISRRWPTIAVTGTHGKSTTTGLIGSMLTESGDAAAVFCGAEVLDRRRHGWRGDGEWAVVEACEYRRHFLELTPEISIVLGIEPDHFDCYPHLDDAIRAYREFLERTNRDGLALVNVDNAAVKTMLLESRHRCRLETMSTWTQAADWTTKEVSEDGGLQLTICYRGEVEDRFKLRMIGRHHAANVLAAYAACRVVGVSNEQARSSLAHFAGLSRRLEPHSDWRNVQRFDDYAHHPTAVRAVLQALKNRLATVAGKRRGRLVCVFQPHQISRTERLATEFENALSVADEVFVTPVYAAREGAGRRAEELAREVALNVSPPCQAQFIPSLDHALVTLETALRPGDIFVTLGAGDIDSLQYELPRRFP